MKKNKLTKADESSQYFNIGVMMMMMGRWRGSSGEVDEQGAKRTKADEELLLHPLPEGRDRARVASTPHAQRQLSAADADADHDDDRVLVHPLVIAIRSELLGSGGGGGGGGVILVVVPVHASSFFKRPALNNSGSCAFFQWHRRRSRRR